MNNKCSFCKYQFNVGYERICPVCKYDHAKTNEDDMGVIRKNIKNNPNYIIVDDIQQRISKLEN